MLYAILRGEWDGLGPLMPSAVPSGWFDSRDEARSTADGGPIVALAARYDADRGVLTSYLTATLNRSGWSAQAIVSEGGGLTAFAAIPPGLIRFVPASEHRSDPARDRLDGMHRPGMATILPFATRRQCALNPTWSRPATRGRPA